MSSAMTIERIKAHLVDMMFASAIDIPDDPVERLERNELSLLEALGLLFGQEQGAREELRICAQLLTSSLCAQVKTHWLRTLNGRLPTPERGDFKLAQLGEFQLTLTDVLGIDVILSLDKKPNEAMHTYEYFGVGCNWALISSDIFMTQGLDHFQDLYSHGVACNP